MHDFFNFGLWSALGIVAIAGIFILTVWTIFWKGLALWVSASEKSKPWFIVLLIINTAGILEIIYLAFFSESGKKWLADFGARRRARAKKKHGDDKDEN